MIRLLQKWLRLPGRLTSKDVDLIFSGRRGAKNILIFTEYVNATYFISFDIPLQRMHARGEINFAVISQQHVKSSGHNCWRALTQKFRPDAVIMTRYGQPFGREILEYFRHAKIPVIYHIDDDLLNLPDSLGEEIQKRQGAIDVVATRQFLLEHCTLIYASTANLAGLLQQRFPAQKIVHGMYAPYLGHQLPAPTPKPHNSAPIIGYMGSKGHKHDLELVVPALTRLLDERPELRFEVFGSISMPVELERFGNRVSSHSVHKSYTHFLAHLAGLQWDIGLAPLADEPFNRCKAPTKFIEYTAAGIPVIASSIGVYAQAIPPGGGLLAEPDHWYTAITRLLDSPSLRQETLATARTHCASQYSLEKLEKQLAEILTTVAPRTPS